MRAIINHTTELLKEKRAKLWIVIRPIKTGRSKYIFENNEFVGFIDGRDKSIFYDSFL